MENIIQLNSVITCPNCGYSKGETMSEDSCQFFYECENCHVILKPLKGDCCVFCSYGNVLCLYPTNFLIDNTGKIFAKNISLGELE